MLLMIRRWVTEIVESFSEVTSPTLKKEVFSYRLCRHFPSLCVSIFKIIVYLIECDRSRRKLLKLQADIR